MDKLDILLLSGGMGTRVGAAVPKQLLKLHGVPILVYSLREIDKLERINNIILNYPGEWLDEYQSIITNYAIKKNVIFVPAGDSRQSSVSLMLDKVTTNNILIHEAARPFVTARNYEEIIESTHQNVTFGLAIPFSVAKIDHATQRISSNVDRSTLLNIQLPQKFNFEDLKRAHEFATQQGRDHTEDTSMLVDIGLDVHTLQGSSRNIKVTTPEDLAVANILAEKLDTL
ncbi:MAG: 2-C-methyl-D-erythritol 4-phosphate cytidylyltransferase [Devosia sp.]|uniref:IspD/TarI family cytidylyltransferase n=1 Tax=Devosia sp. TaxID=1871048 RepID=UPI0024CAB105|nr:IspD/TarI family cytidylyltransferase [Devosia sp.]UYO00438.1 MAG: 2-C-methyl-D-erythritol 4-phosphate cytidylyltransferase [Devosia sp.]